jgi:uncharacterized tellurite resistance protein B-like protein
VIPNRGDQSRQSLVRGAPRCAAGARRRELVAERFELDAEEGDSLIEAAEARVAESVQLHGFTRVIKSAFSQEERIELMEMLWEVVYADGELHHYEANLMRRLAGLMQVSDRDAGAARKRALKRLDFSGA